MLKSTFKYAMIWKWKWKLMLSFHQGRQRRMAKVTTHAQLLYYSYLLFKKWTTNNCFLWQPEMKMGSELSYPMLILMGCIPLFANWQKTAAFLPLQERNTILRGDSTPKRIFGKRWSIPMIHIVVNYKVAPFITIDKELHDVCFNLLQDPLRPVEQAS